MNAFVEVALVFPPIVYVLCNKNEARYFNVTGCTFNTDINNNMHSIGLTWQRSVHFDCDVVQHIVIEYFNYDM